MNFKSIVGILTILLGLPLAILLGRDVLNRLRLKRPMFWVALPFLLGFGILMPLCIEHWTGQRVILMAGLELAVVFLLLGLFGYEWAFRGLGLLVFLAFAAYCVFEFAWSAKEFTLSGRRSEPSPRNALLGLLVIGLPSLWFALKGRFSDDTLDWSPEDAAAAAERLVHPDWHFYERHLERPVLKVLRDLYSGDPLLTKENLEIKTANKKMFTISSFRPLNEESLLDTTDQLGFDIVPLAIDDCGDPIFLKPGVTEPDTVYIAFHEDPGHVEVLSESVPDMIARLRSENTDLGKKLT